MTLAVAKEEIEGFAALFARAGIDSFDESYRGPEVVFTDKAGKLAAIALQMLAERIAAINGRDGRKQFLELLSKALKKHHEAAKKPAEPAATEGKSA